MTYTHTKRKIQIELRSDIRLHISLWFGSSKLGSIGIKYLQSVLPFFIWEFQYLVIKTWARRETFLDIYIYISFAIETSVFK